MIGLPTVIQALLILAEVRLNVQAVQGSPQNLVISSDEYQLQGAAYKNRVVPSLRQALILHRHGDRTPLSFPPADRLKDNEFWAIFGKGELTNEGKSRMYHLGQLMRARYGKLLGGSVDKNKRITYSSSVLRCIESAELFLAAFLRLDQPDCTDCELYKWDTKVDISHIWQPASIRSGKPEIDAMLYSGTHCARFNKLLKQFDQSPRFINEILPLIGARTLYGLPIDSVWRLISIADTAKIEKFYFESQMEPEVLKVYDGLQRAGNLAFGLYQDTVEMRRLRAGLLLGDLIKNMRMMQDEPRKATKIMHYSTHDNILAVLLGMFKGWHDKPVEYSSNLAIELHESKKGEWFVEVLFMSSVPGPVEQLHLRDCEDADPKGKGRCLVNKFIELMGVYLYNNTGEWHDECNKPLDTVMLSDVETNRV